jgi:hypothetical protein
MNSLSLLALTKSKSTRAFHVAFIFLVIFSLSLVVFRTVVCFEVSLLDILLYLIRPLNKFLGDCIKVLEHLLGSNLLHSTLEGLAYCNFEFVLEHLGMLFLQSSLLVMDRGYAQIEGSLLIWFVALHGVCTIIN